MAMIELVDYNELYNADRPKKKTTRRGRSKKTDVAPVAPVAPVVETKATDEEE
jgi:large subunit ribosomal protein L17